MTSRKGRELRGSGRTTGPVQTGVASLRSSEISSGKTAVGDRRPAQISGPALDALLDGHFDDGAVSDAGGALVAGPGEGDDEVGRTGGEGDADGAVRRDLGEVGEHHPG
mgnify:CR=1 FL=1